MVGARLAGLTAPAADLGDTETWDPEDLGCDDSVDVSPLVAGARFASGQQLCDSLGDACYVGTEWASPSPSSTLGAVVLVWMHIEEDVDLGFLLVQDDRGVVVVDQILSCDTNDSYGSLEACESVESVQFEHESFVVQVSGRVDEMYGEADAFWECEEEHSGDEDAAMRCFAERTAGLAPPETWARELRYRVDANGVRAE